MPSPRRRLRTQPRILGKSRTPVSSAFMAQLEAAVQKEVKRWGVSRSFVIATCVAYTLGVNDQPHYR